MLKERLQRYYLFILLFIWLPYNYFLLLRAIYTAKSIFAILPKNDF